VSVAPSVPPSVPPSDRLSALRHRSASRLNHRGQRLRLETSRGNATIKRLCVGMWNCLKTRQGNYFRGSGRSQKSRKSRRVVNLGHSTQWERILFFNTDSTASLKDRLCWRWKRGITSQSACATQEKYDIDNSNKRGKSQTNSYNFLPINTQICLSCTSFKLA